MYNKQSYLRKLNLEKKLTQLEHLQPGDIKNTFFNFFKKIRFFNIQIIIKEFQKFNFKLIKHSVWQTFTFILLLIVYLTGKFVHKIVKFKFFPKIIIEKLEPKTSKIYNRMIGIFELHRTGTIARTELIELCLRNMKVKKTRTIVTVGGMTIGIGAIVFLVSLGYGLQQVVITRVARLEEMKQFDVSPQTGGKVNINDKTLADFKKINNISNVLPLIAVVGRVNYKNSISDMAVYGVTSDYLKQSAIKPVVGKIFESNKLSQEVDSSLGEVAGATTVKKFARYMDKIQDVSVSINPEKWIRVRVAPSVASKILGYTKRIGASIPGEEIWGGEYESDNGVGDSGEDSLGSILGKWVKTDVLLWMEKECDLTDQLNCVDGKYSVVRDEFGKQQTGTGYFAEINIKVESMNIKETSVLGKSSDDVITATDSSSISWVEIASEEGMLKPPETKKISLTKNAKKEAVVNRAMLKIINIDEKTAIGKTFDTSFIIIGNLLSDQKEKVESIPATYTIVGVTPEEKTPVFYVPFFDIRSLGVVHYSQVKAVVNSQKQMINTRKQVEAMGYATRSVMDTVSQINSLFSTLRLVLILLGMVALAVASLGMFNTLTVSLLERTREVGLMKAMGMKSYEVQELFLTESMIMGFFGGIFGIIVGFLCSKMIGLVLSIFSVIKGFGLIDVSYLPFSFVIIVILLSLFVGVVTGIYPARRATKISALDALRYE